MMELYSKPTFAGPWWRLVQHPVGRCEWELRQVYMDVDGNPHYAFPDGTPTGGGDPCEVIVEGWSPCRPPPAKPSREEWIRQAATMLDAPDLGGVDWKWRCQSASKFLKKAILLPAGGAGSDRVVGS